jgi:hypothetical protein
VLPTKFRFIWLLGFRGEDFLIITRKKNWWPCLLTDGDKMSILSRGPSIDASYQVAVCLTKRFQRRWFFRNRPIRNKNCLWRPCLLMDRDEMCNLYRGPPIDASYPVSVHLAKRFQRRRFFLIDQSETIIACGGHVCYRIGTKCAFFIEDLP